MTASVVDPVYPAILPSLTEPISIDVTTDPLDMTITILYANGAWEVAYQDGVFSAVYAPSTRSTTHFEILRKGGWFPGRSFTVKVKETAPGAVVPPPVGDVGLGLKWRLLYGVDFTTLSSIPSITPGQVIIDGKTWWLKGAAPASGTLTVKVEPGSGLTFAGVGVTQTEGTTVQPPNKQLRMFMPFAGNLPDYAPGAPLIALGHLKSASGGSTNSFVCLIDDTNDAVYPTQAALDTRIGLSRGWNNTLLYTVSNGAQLSAQFTPAPPHDYRDEYIGVMMVNKFMGMTAVYLAGGFIDPYSTPMLGGITDPAGSYPGVAGQSYPLFIKGTPDATKRGFSFSTHTFVASTYDVSLQSIKIFQPKVTA